MNRMVEWKSSQLRGGRKRGRLVRVAIYKEEESEVESRVEQAVLSGRIRVT